MDTFWIVTLSLVGWCVLGVMIFFFFDRRAGVNLPSSWDAVIISIIVFVCGPVMWAMFINLFLGSKIKLLGLLCDDDINSAATGILVLIATVAYFFISHYLGYI
ncbi:MAG TPA: hypothetical protein VK145_01155 [Candidatus Nanoarchaeia archaeon]|nr:hypothetical protein [Candidatus Nanoarchaeia archaeon]